jgi:hypothetical protein
MYDIAWHKKARLDSRMCHGAALAREHDVNVTFVRVLRTFHRTDPESFTCLHLLLLPPRVDGDALLVW